MKEYFKRPLDVVEAVRSLGKLGLSVSLPDRTSTGEMFFRVEGQELSVTQILELFDKNELELGAIRRIVARQNENAISPISSGQAVCAPSGRNRMKTGPTAKWSSHLRTLKQCYWDSRQPAEGGRSRSMRKIVEKEAGGSITLAYGQLKERIGLRSLQYFPVGSGASSTL